MTPGLLQCASQRGTILKIGLLESRKQDTTCSLAGDINLPGKIPTFFRPGILAGKSGELLLTVRYKRSAGFEANHFRLAPNLAKS